LGNEGIVLLLEPILEQLTAFVGKSMTGSRKHTESKTANIPNCKSCKKRLLDIEQVILIGDYYQTVKTEASYDSTDGPTARPTDNPHKSDVFRDFHQIIAKLTVRAY